MKTSSSYRKILVLMMVMVTVLLGAALPCGAVEKENEQSNCIENEPNQRHKWFELTDEKVERIMSRLSESDPEKAKELEQLRQEDPEKFKAELRKVMREQLGKMAGEHMREYSKEGGSFAEHKWSDKADNGRKREMSKEGMRGRHTEYLEWLGENYPEETGKLAGLKETNPELYMKELELSLKRYGRIAEAAKRNPELAEVLKQDLELKKDRNKLLGRIKAAGNETEKKELIGELEKVVSNKFDLLIKRKQIAYEQLLKRLERLKGEVKESEAEVEKWKDAKFKDENVKARVEKLLNKPE